MHPVARELQMEDLIGLDRALKSSDKRQGLADMMHSHLLQ